LNITVHALQVCLTVLYVYTFNTIKLTSFSQRLIERKMT